MHENLTEQQSDIPLNETGEPDVGNYLALRSEPTKRTAKICFNAVFLNHRVAAPVPGPGINYTGPREGLLEFVILVF